MIRKIFCAIIAFAFIGQVSAQLPYLIIEETDTTIDADKYNKYILNHPYTTRTPLLKEDLKKMDKKDRPDLAYEHDWLMTHDPTDGKIHWERLIPVLKQMNTKQVQTVAPGGSAANAWTERGPNNVGGRVRAMMFDPTDNTNKKVFAGGVGGGLWYNNDITSNSSSWVAVNDFWANLAVSAMDYDPTSTSTFYVGTGEGFGNADAMRGAGVWKSTNKGASWTQLASTNNSSFRYVLDLKVTSTGRVVVASSGGLYTSDNGGTSFTRRISTSYVGDIEIASNGDLYASTRASGRVYKSTNNGTSWSTITPSGTSARRVELACAPSDSNTIYGIGGATTSSNTDISWFKKSTNGGVSWTNLTIPKYASNTSYHFTRKQAWYDLILWVHPTNKNMVVAGGIDLHRTTNGGSTWSPVSYWNTSQWPLPEVHADQHMILSRPGNNNEVIIGNDGGVYYSTNLGNSSTSAPTYSHRVRNFNVTQFYSAAIHPTAGSNVMVAGAQDNGTIKLSSAGAGSGTEITGGDGAFCFIDQNNSSVFITSYVYNNWRRSTNSGSSFNYLPSDNTGRFINPADYDDNLNILYAAKTSTTIKRITNMTGSYSATDVTVSSLGGTPTHIRVSPYTTTSTTLFVGASSDVYKITNANTTPSVSKITPSSFPNEYISCVEVGASENELLVTFSSYGGQEVYYTSNGGTNWSNKSGNLPDMPIRWALFNPKNRKEVIVATELGVWATSDITASSPTWTASNNGLANTRVDMLQYRASDSTIMASTHGRGVFTGRFKAQTSTKPVASFTASKDTVCVSELVTYTSTSTNSPTTTTWTFSGGSPGSGSGTTATTTYFTSGLKSVTLFVSNSSGSDTKVQSLVYVMSNPTASISSISSLCVTDPAIVLTQGSPSGGIYSGTGVSGGMFNPLTAGVGTHTIKYKLTNGAGCSDSATTTVTVTNRPAASASSIPPVCSNAPSFALSNGSPTGGTYSGTGVSGGVFNPSAAGPGIHTINYIYGSATCRDTATFSIVVNAAPNVTLGSIGPFCTTQGNQTLTQGSPSGGVYSGTGVSGGNFNPSTAGAGNHTIKYVVTNSNGCKDSATTTVTVSNGITASASSVPNQCSNAASFTLTNGSPTGGTYSGTGVSSGSFNPATAGPGTHSIKYVVGAGSCKDSTTFNIVVNAAPTVTLSSIGPFCTTDPVQSLTQGSPLGGTYSGTGVTGSNFSPSTAGVGNHTIKYVVTNSNGCKDSATTTVNVTSGATASASIVPNQCSNSASFTLTNGSPTGGTYSGTGVLAGAFNPSAAGVGTHTIKYVIGSGSCKDSTTFTIVVDSAPNVTFASIGPFCSSDPTQTLTQGSPSGGVYSGTGVSGNTFSPSTAGVGSHTLKYVVTNSKGCKDSATTTAQVSNGITPTLGSFSPVCESDAAFNLTGGSPSGGTYSGVGVSRGKFDPAVAGAGTHTISYTHPLACSGVKATSTILVDSGPNISITADTSVCLGSSVQLSASGGSSYVWTPGSSLNDSTIAMPFASPLKTTTYSVSASSSNGCKASKSVKVTVEPLPKVDAGKDNTTCQGTPYQLGASGANSYIWSPSTGLSSTIISNPVATLSNSQLYVVLGTGVNGCSNADSVLITVLSKPNASMDSLADVCVKASSFALTGGRPAGGTYSGTGVTGGSFSPGTAGTGSHTIIYTVSNGKCSSSVSTVQKVVSSPAIAWTTKLTYCDNESAVTPSANPAGGVFSGSAINNGMIDPVKLGAGRFEILYDYSDPNGCEAKETKEVVVHPTTPVDSIRGIFRAVINKTYSYNVTAVNGSSYLWTVKGGSVQFKSANTITIKWGLGPKGFLHLIQTNQFGCVDSTDAEVLLGPLGNEEVSFNSGKLTLFPNPVSDVLNVKLTDLENLDELDYQIVNLEGKAVVSGSLEVTRKMETFKIDLSALSPGVYFFQTGEGESQVMKPVVINK